MTTARITELVDALEDALEDDHATKAACERLLSSAERLRFRALYRDAKAQGRREAFAEVLRNFEVLRGYDMVHPLATFLHWLDEAAK